MDNTNKQYSEHFINFVLKGEKFDFNVFKTREEFDRYREEVDEFLRENESKK